MPKETISNTFPFQINNILNTATLHNKIIDAKNAGKTTILVHGIFDLLHIGHLAFFLEAKRYADILIVGIDSDKMTTFSKGPSRPFRNFDERALLVANCKPVDYVFKIDAKHPQANMADFYVDLYRYLAPNYVATNVSAGRYQKLIQRQSKLAHIKFLDLAVTKYLTEITTTRLVEKILATQS